MRVRKGNTVVARGAIKIHGEAEVLGARVAEFRTTKYTPIFCIDDCEIEIQGEYTIIEKDTIPESWKRLAKKDWETLFIYGGVDRGKSTLATYLSNKCDGCYVLDLDIGQSDIAHPAAMGYGYAKNVVSISEVEMINGFFVGIISPSGRESKCLRGVIKLWNELKKIDGKKIVDTTGWIKGKRAREYKLAKLEIIQPDIIASFEGKPDFLEDYNVFEVESGIIFERDKAERAKIRFEMYSKWLNSAKDVEVDKKSVKVRTDIFNGKDIPTDFISEILGVDVVFARKGSDFLAICVEKRVNVNSAVVKGLRELYEVEDVYIFSKDDLKNLVVGLYRGRKYLGLGVIKEIGDSRLVIQSKFSDFDRVEFGEFKLDNGKEYIVRIP